FRAVPRFAGFVAYDSPGQPQSTLGMLQELVPNQGGGWEWTLEELGRFCELRVAQPFPPELEQVNATTIVALSEAALPEALSESIGITLDLTAVLARRTAEMHLALAAGAGDDALRPEPMTGDDLTLLAGRLAAHAAEVFGALKNNLGRLPDDVVETAGLLLSRRRALLDRFRGLEQMDTGIVKIRVHGDYHLGQVLRVEHDYCILDFEGEPARSVAERRTKQSPLKDVAGMLRSFSYAAWSAFLNYTARRPQDAAALEPWTRLWEKANGAVFLKTYREITAGTALCPSDSEGFSRLLDAFVLDKALYELNYEMNNRPTWVRAPLMGLLSLC
ncbi:MAG: maltose alpha-D-glucosyltransferase, partial [Bryobacteraceae bacterium]